MADFLTNLLYTGAMGYVTYLLVRLSADAMHEAVDKRQREELDEEG